MSHLPKRVSSTAALFFALLGASCATMKQKESLEKLKDSVDDYNHAFRWKNYPEAAKHLPEDQRAAFVATYEDNGEGLEIEDLQIGQVNVVNPTYAQVVVRIRFTLLPSITIQKKTAIQHWHDVEGRWHLEKEDNSILKPELIGPAPTGSGTAGDHRFFDGAAPIEPPEVESPDSELLPDPERKDLDKDFEPSPDD
ncbi:MAG: hypothetical protein HY791_39850 [Deltaproteobacteria bacterium]|nr:hypothetical protein [Deltaproteobacteria bacterium]